MSTPHAPAHALSASLLALMAASACSAPAPPPATQDNAGPATPATARDALPPAPVPVPDKAADMPQPPVVDAPAAVTPVPEPPPTMPAQTSAPAAGASQQTSAPLPMATTSQKPRSQYQAAAPAQDTQRHGIAITMLSRGKGVPAETRDAYKQIRAMLEEKQATAAVSAMHSKRIGLEGETRLCVEFDDAEQAQAALAQIRKLAKDVDLLNVVETSCPSAKEPTP